MIFIPVRETSCFWKIKKILSSTSFICTFICVFLSVWCFSIYIDICFQAWPEFKITRSDGKPIIRLLINIETPSYFNYPPIIPKNLSVVDFIIKRILKYYIMIFEAGRYGQTLVQHDRIAFEVHFSRPALLSELNGNLCPDRQVDRFECHAIQDPLFELEMASCWDRQNSRRLNEIQEGSVRWIKIHWKWRKIITEC